ncbi:hypothetical protein [Sandarakinorhabdus sp.]|uniref:type IV pilus modification PilV family protein n=1 Tax=Sandarakinorhabdus sp. TaxID=1916663 RepID=UPI00286E3102|nr:hypothetical protein [Sandarakinorhabdus sp.]
MNGGNSQRDGSERGSVLVEALVAILIVVAMSGLWFDALGSSARQQADLADRRAALLVARSQLAAAGIVDPLIPGETSGSDAGFAWRVVVAPFPAAGEGIEQVVVAVGRPGGGDLATLQTLRLGQ